MRRALQSAGTFGLAMLAVVLVAEAMLYERSAQPASTYEWSAPEAVVGWERVLPATTRLAGLRRAPVRIVVLADLECPACRRFHAWAKEVVGRRPAEAQLLHVHYPLDYHEAARPAALGAECALSSEGNGGFRRWVDAVYHGQDSLVHRDWARYAVDAGLRDPRGIVECIQAAADTSRIAAGIAFGNALPVEWSPTVLVEGWRFHRSPNIEELDSAIDAILAGHRPEQARLPSGR